MEIKHSNWFAAGPEIQRALLSLSDGAFRLYFYLCLNASRRTGKVSMRYAEIAQALKRSRRSISSHFDELRNEGICIINPAVNQHHCNQIEIADEFWPYTKEAVADQATKSAKYIERIKFFLCNRSCVQSSFGKRIRNSPYNSNQAKSHSRISSVG